MTYMHIQLWLMGRIIPIGKKKKKKEKSEAMLLSFVYIWMSCFFLD